MAQLKLSLLASLDDLHRCTNSLVTADALCESEFLKFIPSVEQLWIQWSEATTECRRLQKAVEESQHNSAKLVSKLTQARKMLETEQKARAAVEREKRALELHLGNVRDALLDPRNKINEDVKDKISLINQNIEKVNWSGIPNSVTDRLDPIAELDSTGSLLSELSYSRSEDDLDVSTSFFDKRKDYKKCRPAPNDCAPSPKRRRSSIRRSVDVHKSEVTSDDRVVATTTVTVRREGNITAHSKIEAKPSGRSKGAQDLFPSAPPISIVTDSTNSDSSPNNNNWATPQNVKVSMAPPSVTRSTLDNSPSYGMARKNMNFRSHTFVKKTTICPEACNYCSKRLKFGKLYSKCQDCRAPCHLECEGLLPLPCIPVGNTPAVKGSMGTIADYTPMTSPMVPSLIVHCIREIESRGLNEVGIYRVPGAERDVKALKESFLRGKGAPNLSNVDVHVLCGAVKDFLRSLREPLILRTYWHDFVQATEIPDPEDAQAALYQAVSELPQPNRDTLAAVILHLQHVAECPECKMPIGNLSKIFGPTLVGYSSSDLEPEVLLFETKKQAMVVDQLMRLPSDYWANFANPSGSENRDPAGLTHTPSTGSLRNGPRNFLGTTPKSVRGKKKFFSTPPASKY
ncbi:Rac GTPase-activating protein 1 [Frankliniella fusca]|uniref:Rac GTPase-activating protein 1 n=1 Tax=Frankliniella fusca TaxID=407009 RepID=A0AAE1GX74_9NEOP|nr:Rac GTPase-activating protein 1 [Frankliniella fusca]